MKKSVIDYLLVEVRSDPTLPDRINRLAELAQKRLANFSLLGSGALLTYGDLMGHDSSGSRRLRRDLKQEFGKDIKILYGSEIAPSGFMGNHYSLGYNILLSHLTDARTKLEALPWGAVEEFPT